MLLAFVSLLLAVQAVHAAPDHCFERSAQRYGLDANLLKAIAHVESGMRPDALSRSGAGTTLRRDIGLMQINSSWLPRLARYGISERDLFEACTNLDVGAWILANEFSRRGATWDAVGAYNASCTTLKGDACAAARARYAWRVFGSLNSTPGKPRSPQANAVGPKTVAAVPGLVATVWTTQPARPAEGRQP